jgi:ABC-type transport system involved in cytochrome c biogenesis ATPase subunit
VSTRPRSGGRELGLADRETERAVLDQFTAGVRAGKGQALVVRGEPGVGKTVLLDYLAGRLGISSRGQLSGVLPG